VASARTVWVMTEQDHERRGSVVAKMIGGAVAAGIGVRLDTAAAIVLGTVGFGFEGLGRATSGDG
jgi:hypothetical protein